MKLTQFIPEIKINPISNQPQVGDQILFTESGGLYNITEISEGVLSLIHNRSKSIIYLKITTYNKFTAEDDIKLIKRKDIKEIKIQPLNRKPKIGDVFKSVKTNNEYTIINEDGGYWETESSASYGSNFIHKDDVEDRLKSGKFIFISKT